MMPLVSEVPLDEVVGEEERFDFLDGVRHLVLKAMEFHASEENDSEYVYLFWTDNDALFNQVVRANVERLMNGPAFLDGGWMFDVNSNGTGLVLVRAYF